MKTFLLDLTTSRKMCRLEMKEDPRINKDILSDLQIFKLIELEDSALVIRT